MILYQIFLKYGVKSYFLHQIFQKNLVENHKFLKKKYFIDFKNNRKLQNISKSPIILIKIFFVYQILTNDFFRIFKILSKIADCF